MNLKDKLVKRLQENRPQLEERFLDIKGLSDEEVFKYFYRTEYSAMRANEGIQDEMVISLKPEFADDELLPL
ncbi:hypothetical protein ACP6L2_03880 [Sphingobacterium lactis]|uniref:hypothetical protein n=1 Tax=Sphingobacterium lactis TaxID=797291 RepID=UPI003F80CC47